MRFRHLEVFSAIMQTGSVSAAAQRLRVSQPSVTKTLRQAEQDLGYALFDRVKGRLQATEEARALYKEVARAYAALDDVRQMSVRLKHGMEGLIRVASTPSLGLEILPEAIALYVKDHAYARFDVSTQHSGDLLSALGRPGQGFDLGFTFGTDGAPPGIVGLEIGRVPLACIFAPGVLRDELRVVRTKDLAAVRTIGLEDTEPLGRLLSEQSRALGMSLQSPVRVQTYQLACSLARRGLGVAIVDGCTASAFARNLRSDSIRMVPFEPDVMLTVTAVYPAAQGLPLAARRLVDAFQKSLGTRIDRLRPPARTRKK